MGALKDMVLFIYTMALFVLHAAGLYHLFHSEWTSGFEYREMAFYLGAITAIQYLDIPFSFFLTRSNPYAVFVQVSGRLFTLYAATYMVGWKYVAFTLVAVYLISELCRGPYYMTNCLKTPNKPLTWLRYNAFKVLYPIGFTCEALVFINVLFVSGRVPIDIRNKNFMFSLVFAAFFFTIVNFLYQSMSKKAEQKNRQLKNIKTK
ncbi:hypothetical protein GCK72_009192 [Caenorhabditis remanei]|uniref:Very-long-chain (3R)-3-hydroxyacyl-CoA dehydratase n=1 Tax=Caenorhabditis remanei TaxID=31234 RepID=E3ML20_CAERE|nr:hypothetical protein GCK72_009192 [Caenorhabditis remanei]EFP04292.1 hypothetical protein CRE_26700 [Caenorhabditis remanei]KAF1760939.1 hypothetical protein GCK72_009192 [Caenorhabditis remanei]